MRAYYSGNTFSTENIWFESFDSCDELKKTETSADTVRVYANPTEITGKNVVSQKQYTVISDIAGKSDEELMKGFPSNLRNEIRRAERENTVSKIYSSEDILKDSSVLDRMADFYTNMYKEKGMDGVTLPIGELLSYARKGALVISTASIEGAETVFHSYVASGKNTRLLHSCSEFRVADNAMRNAIGRANKFLHFEDMRYFRDLGADIYDWGGLSSAEEPNGIDKFKLSFGGEMIFYYNVIFTRSLKKRIFDKIKK